MLKPHIESPSVINHDCSRLAWVTGSSITQERPTEVCCPSNSVGPQHHYDPSLLISTMFLTHHKANWPQHLNRKGRIPSFTHRSSDFIPTLGQATSTRVLQQNLRWQHWVISEDHICKHWKFEYWWTNGANIIISTMTSPLLTANCCEHATILTVLPHLMKSMSVILRGFFYFCRWFSAS